MFRTKYLLPISSVALSLCTQAMASTSSSGTVNLYAPSGATLAFMTSGVRSAPPACATDAAWTITLSAANETMVASILSFYLSGQPFEVIGSGTCDGSREIVAYIAAH